LLLFCENDISLCIILSVVVYILFILVSFHFHVITGLFIPLILFLLSQLYILHINHYYCYSYFWEYICSHFYHYFHYFSCHCYVRFNVTVITNVIITINMIIYVIVIFIIFFVITIFGYYYYYFVTPLWLLLLWGPIL